ncbi:acylneuraminate cytidylyltransferase family protein [Roseivivax sp.]
MSDKGLLAIIPARGGSKGLPRKNVLPLGAQPLIAWTIRAALASAAVQRVIVSTDDREIAEAARAAGAEVPFLRPPELASDTATSADVVAHALAQAPGFASGVLLQPTSPFRTAEDIDAAQALWRAGQAATCVSVCEAEESPWLMFTRDQGGQLGRVLPLPEQGLRRQDLAPAYLLNGAMYFFRTEDFLADRQFVSDDTVGYVMPRARSLDIDTAEDLELARERLAAWGGRVPMDVE